MDAEIAEKMPEKRTLADLLLALNDLDQAPSISFDPKELTDDLADKVDAIKTVMDRLEKEAERLDAEAGRFLKASAGCRANAGRLEEYVRWTMEQLNFERLPGRLYSLRLQKSGKAFKPDRQPTAEDMVAMPHLVRRSTSYAWEANEIKATLQNGGIFPYGRLVDGKKQIKFDIRKGET